MLRRRPVIGAPVAHGASDHLKRSIGTFQLTLFGVGATVGTGIFFVLSVAVPEAGPAVIVSFIIAGIAAGLSAICYAELASAVPVSGSTYAQDVTSGGHRGTQPWMTPSPAPIDAEYAAWAAEFGADSQREAQRCLDQIADGLDAGYKPVANRTADEGLVEAAEELGAEVLVVGSSPNGALGQVVLGSTTDWLLHTAPVPVAISPRG